jgi:hypothetical protein
MFLTEYRMYADYFDAVEEHLSISNKDDELMLLEDLIEIYEEVLLVFEKIVSSQKFIANLLLTPEMIAAFNKMIKSTLMNSIPQIEGFENEVFIYIITIRKCLLELSGVVYSNMVITPYGTIQEVPNSKELMFNDPEIFHICKESVKYTQSSVQEYLSKSVPKLTPYNIQEYLFKVHCTYKVLLTRLVKQHRVFAKKDITEILTMLKSVHCNFYKLDNLDYISKLVIKKSNT